MTIVVADAGVGMSPNPDSQGLGFGLPVVGAFTDSVRVETPRGGGTKVTMHFRPSSAAP